MSSPHTGLSVGFVAATTSARSLAALEATVVAAIDVGAKDLSSLAAATAPSGPVGGAATLPSALIVCVVDAFTPLVEAATRRFALSLPAGHATIAFVQPLPPSADSQPSSAPSVAAVYILRTGLGAHMAPLQDATLLPMAPQMGHASPLAVLLRSAAAGITARSAPAAYAVGMQGADGACVSVEFTQVLPAALRAAAASDMHVACVAERLAH